MTQIKITLHPINDRALIERLRPDTDAGMPLAIAAKRLLYDLIALERIAAMVGIGTHSVSAQPITAPVSVPTAAPIESFNPDAIDFDAMAAELGA